jgi:hypothetical protein
VDDEARTVGAALRLTAEAGQLLSIWRQSPLRVLARLHLVAAADKADQVGRPRQEGEPVDEPLVGLPRAPGPASLHLAQRPGRACGRADRPGRQRPGPEVGLRRRGRTCRAGARGLSGGPGRLRLRYSRGHGRLDRALRQGGGAGRARVDGGVRGTPARSGVSRRRRGAT